MNRDVFNICYLGVFISMLISFYLYKTTMSFLYLQIGSSIGIIGLFMLIFEARSKIRSQIEMDTTK